MPYRTQWLIPERVLFVHYYGDLPIEEFQELAAYINDICANRPQAVHTIADTRELKRFPMNIGANRQTSSHTHVTGWRVVIVNNAVLRFIIDTVARTLRLRMHFSSSIEDSLAFLKSVDPTLNTESKSVIEI